MPQYGSSQNLISTNLSQTVDNQGNPIISSDTGFGASPLGYAARAQALFGLPNSTFELTPPDTNAVISAANPLPYWDVQDYSSGVMSGSAIYDSATNSWGVNLNPGTATTNDYITMTTRSYLINDDNLSLRQQALVVVSKVGTYAGTTQWNLELTASYYDSTNALLHSGTVATIYDNTTWTSMAGTTTTGGTAISASAHYVDLQFKLTATAPVTSATSVTIKSAILQTSTGTGGGQSFIVTETFTSSTTWTRPTGVDYLLVLWGVGAGGGGAGGGCWAGYSSTNNFYAHGVGGGGGARIAVVRDLYIGGTASISVGIGAGGSGGTATSVSKTAAGTAQVFGAGGNGSNGGATTFGSYLTIPGGSGGSFGGTAAVTGGSGGGAGGTVTSPVLGYVEYTGGAGANGGNSGTATTPTAAGNAGTSAVAPFTYFPYATESLGNVGQAGGTATHTVTGSGSVYIGTATAAGTGVNLFSGGGGATGGLDATAAPPTIAASSEGGRGGGGAGERLQMWNHSTSPAMQAEGTAGNGGNAGANTGAGGGAGGGAGMASANSTRFSSSVRGTAYSGEGGDGGSGLIVIAYVG